MSGGAQAAAKLPPAKALLLSLTAAALIGVIIFAVRQETAARAPAAAASFTAGLGAYRNAPPLSAEEEAYAAALWPVHSEVKLAAVRMIFAGLHYKTGNGDAEQLREKVRPLVGTFESARQRALDIPVPASLDDARASYLHAMELYAAAAREMLKLSDEGGDRHLIEAQKQSEQASLALLKLSDVLWPGEYKPN